MAKRKSISKTIQDDLLTLSARRCCLCFGLQADFDEKKGQIAHLDHNPANSELDNLVWLCFDHHDQYDSKTSQSKGLRIGEVKRYRAQLYQAVEEMREGKRPASTESPSEVRSEESIVSRAINPRIFLCHASDDKAQIRELYHQLKAAGYHPWLDEVDLLPGQDWWSEIKKVISDPYNLVVVCLSHNSVTKRGVVQREIKRALDVLEEMPENTIYLIPARLEDCQPPDRLSDLHWVDLFDASGFEKLKGALDFENSKRQPL